MKNIILPILGFAYALAVDFFRSVSPDNVNGPIQTIFAVLYALYVVIGAIVFLLYTFSFISKNWNLENV